jgi:ComF family protein
MTSPMRSLARSAADAFVSVALAPACAACDRVLDAPLDGPVCAVCWSSVVPARPQVITAADSPLSASRAAGEYEGSLSRIIHAFKYDGRRSLAAPLARLLRDAGADVLRDADFVVPVPLHLWRRLRRGFNQSAELAKQLDAPLCHALWRTRATVPQTGLRPAQRRRNVRKAFRLSPLVDRTRLENACVVLVDDVRTTGATLDACARVLLDAGAREVRALTAAQATLPV